MKNTLRYFAFIGALSTMTVTAADPAASEYNKPAQNNTGNKGYSDSQRDGGNADNPHGQQLTPSRFVETAYLSGLKEIEMSQLAASRSEKSEVKTFARRMVQDHTKLNEQLTQLAQKKGWTLPTTNDVRSNGSISSSDSQLTTPGNATGNRDAIASDRRTTEIGNPGNGVRDRRNTNSERESGTGRDVRAPKDNSELGGRGHLQGKMSIESLRNASAGEFDKLYMQNAVRGHKMAVKKFENATQNISDEEVRSLAKEALPQLKEHLQQAMQLAQSVGATIDDKSDWKEHDEKRGVDQRPEKP